MSKNVAFLFPGQGSQYVGMGKDIYETFSEIKTIWEEASDVLKIDFKKKIFDSSEEELKDTEILQPSLFLVSYSIASLLEKNGIIPSFVLGHSLGEYTAVAFARVLSFEEALKLVQFRAKAMKEAVLKNPGSMAAIIGLDYDTIENIAKDVRENTGLYVGGANFNSPSQIVISGHKEAIDKFIEIAKEKAKKIVVLPVSGAFHSPLMEEAKTKLSDYLKDIEFNAPKYKIVFNYNAQVEEDPNKIKELLINQTVGCVKWVDSISLLYNNGIMYAYETGPGKVLKGLVRSINREIKVESTDSVENINNILESL